MARGKEIDNIVMVLVVSKDSANNFVLKPIKVNWTGHGSNNKKKSCEIVIPALARWQLAISWRSDSWRSDSWRGGSWRAVHRRRAIYAGEVGRPVLAAR